MDTPQWGTIGQVRRIVLYGNPILRFPAQQVEKITPELLQIMADLLTTMKKKDGVGLAANQIGERVAVIAINPQSCDLDSPPTCIINPKVLITEGVIEAEEGCLSFPDIYEIVPRPEMVKVQGISPEGKELSIEATKLLARALLHEIEHLQGVLFIDHLSELRRRLLASRLKEIEAREKGECE
ncbi:MAG: peptide deformylase [candidate division WOR-3 bacterium]